MSLILKTSILILRWFASFLAYLILFKLLSSSGRVIPKTFFGPIALTHKVATKLESMPPLSPIMTPDFF